MSWNGAAVAVAAAVAFGSERRPAAAVPARPHVDATTPKTTSSQTVTPTRTQKDEKEDAVTNTPLRRSPSAADQRTAAAATEEQTPLRSPSFHFPASSSGSGTVVASPADRLRRVAHDPLVRVGRGGRAAANRSRLLVMVILALRALRPDQPPARR